MTAFEKAISRIEAEAAARGGYPAEIDLTLYPDAKTFDRYFLGESYSDHIEQRRTFLTWCEQHDIRVVDRIVAKSWPLPLRL